MKSAQRTERNDFLAILAGFLGSGGIDGPGGIKGHSIQDCLRQWRPGKYPIGKFGDLVHQVIPLDTNRQFPLSKATVAGLAGRLVPGARQGKNRLQFHANGRNGLDNLVRQKEREVSAVGANSAGQVEQEHKAPLRQKL
jgi:hypothetical protein